MLRLPFDQIWAVDFEFGVTPGNNPDPVCVVGLELKTGRKVRLWRDEFGELPPYPTDDPSSLFVAFYASAEIGCHLALDAHESEPTCTESSGPTECAGMIRCDMR
jgi:DNA polymerase I